jgi:hypothetical protein
MDWEQVCSLYDEYVRDALKEHRADQNVIAKNRRAAKTQAETLYPNWGEEYDKLCEEAEKRANEEMKISGDKWHKAKKEALERIRPYAPDGFIEAME